MKRLLQAIISGIVSLFLLASCTGERVAVVTDGSSSDEEASEPVESVYAWMNYGFEKVISSDGVPNENKRETSVTLYMGKGESESATLSVYSENKLSKASLKTEGLPDGVTATLYKQHYQTINKKTYPDGISLLNETFLIKKQTVQSYLVTFTTTAQTEAGESEITLELLGDDGEVLSECRVILHVFDITYDGYNFRTATDIEEDVLAKLSGLEVGTEEFREIYSHYYEKLLSYRMCAYDLPYDILDPRADAYMSDPRVTAFQIPTAVDDETLIAYYEKVCSNEEWLEKAYAYPFDEPTSVEMYDKVITLVERIERLCPSLKVVVPFFMNFDYDGERDAIDVQAQYMEIFCINTEVFDRTDFASRVREELTENKEIELWTYVCWGPRYPYLNLFVNEKGIDHRILLWQMYSLGADGFLYWSSTYWSAVGNPWTSMMTVPGLSTEVFGDGSLLYTGIGDERACGSLRLELVRDGIEDVELLKMAEELFGREWVIKKMKDVTYSLINYTQKTSTFITARNEIASAVEEALKSGK